VSGIGIIGFVKRELKYPDWYHYELYQEIANRVITSQSFSLTGLPGSGRTSALRVLSYNPTIQKVHFPNDSVLFVFVDTHGLGSIDENDYTRLLYDELVNALIGVGVLAQSEVRVYQNLTQLKQLLSDVSEQFYRIVFICNRFFVLEASIQLVVQSLRLLRDVAKDNVIFIPILEHPDQTTNNVMMLSLHPLTLGSLYMPLFEREEVERSLLLYQDFYSLTVSDEIVKKTADYAGGHAGLSIALLRAYSEGLVQHSAGPEELIIIDTVNRELRRIWEYLSSEQQQYIRYFIHKAGMINRESGVELLYKMRLIDSEGGLGIPLLQAYIEQEVPPRKSALFRIDGGRVFLGECEIEQLSLTEYRVIEHLVTHTNTVVSRDDIAGIIAPESDGSGVSNEAIDQCVSRIRKKIASAGGNTHTIKTVFGRGYMLES
jgi:DNA-binding winged helix-turn-helix (wHTH) protein